MNIRAFLKNCNPFGKKNWPNKYVIYKFNPPVYDGPFSDEKASEVACESRCLAPQMANQIYISDKIPSNAEHIDGKHL